MHDCYGEDMASINGHCVKLVSNLMKFEGYNTYLHIINPAIRWRAKIGYFIEMEYATRTVSSRNYYGHAMPFTPGQT